MPSREKTTARVRWGWALAFSLVVALAGAGLAHLHWLRTPQRAGDSEVHDFDHGPVLLSTRTETPTAISHEFTIRNASQSEPLRLTRLQASCGCVEVECREVPPLGEGQVRVAFYPRLQIEERREHVLFATNQHEKKIVFQVRGTMLPAICFARPTTFHVAAHDPAVGELSIVLHERADNRNRFVLSAHQNGVALRQTSATRSRLDGRVTRHDMRYSVELAQDSLEMLRDTGRVLVDLSATFGDEVLHRQCEFVSIRRVRADPASVFVRRSSQPRVVAVALIADVEFVIKAVHVSCDTIEVDSVQRAPSKEHHLAVTIRPQQPVLEAAGRTSITESTITVWIDTCHGESLAEVVIPVFVAGWVGDPA